MLHNLLQALNGVLSYALAYCSYLGMSFVVGIWTAIPKRSVNEKV